MKPHCDVAEGPTWHSPRSGLVQPTDRANEGERVRIGTVFGRLWRAPPHGSSAALAIYAHPHCESPLLRLRTVSCSRRLARLEVGRLSPAWTGSGFRGTHDYSRVGCLLGNQRHRTVLSQPGSLGRQCHWCWAVRMRMWCASGGGRMGLPLSGRASERSSSRRFCYGIYVGAVWSLVGSRHSVGCGVTQVAEDALCTTPWLTTASSG